MVLDKVKYKNIILYLANELGGKVRGKKKLAKLLYFVDFDFFEKYEKSLTGDVYKALPMGPVPVSMQEIVRELELENKINITSEEDGPGLNPTQVYLAQKKIKPSVFDKNEISILNRVVKKYGHLNGKQLEDLSHAEAPYIGTEPAGVISYELSFYRGTEFSEDD